YKEPTDSCWSAPLLIKESASHKPILPSPAADAMVRLIGENATARVSQSVLIEAIILALATCSKWIAESPVTTAKRSPFGENARATGRDEKSKQPRTSRAAPSQKETRPSSRPMASLAPSGANTTLLTPTGSCSVITSCQESLSRIRTSPLGVT